MPSRRGIRLKRIKQVKRAGDRIDRYYRHPSGRMILLPDLAENHPDFVKAYHEAAASDAQPRRKVEGSLRHVAGLYQSSTAWKSLGQQTRQQRARILKLILEVGGKGVTAGDLAIIEIQTRHIQRDIDKFTANVARNRMKVWRGLMKYAKGIWRDDDPSRAVEVPKYEITGHHTWTDDEIAQFRAFHKSGTRERMALELLLWSAARKADAVGLGRQHVRRGHLTYTQNKTGVTVTIPVTDEFDREMAQMPASQMLFMITSRGKGHSEKAFGAWFKAACKAAGLPPRCVVHGLRKARARIMAENGATTSMIAAWTGHKTLAEVQHYTDEADRAKLTDQAAKLEQNSTLFQKAGKA